GAGQPSPRAVPERRSRGLGYVCILAPTAVAGAFLLSRQPWARVHSRPEYATDSMPNRSAFATNHAVVAHDAPGTLTVDSIARGGSTGRAFAGILPLPAARGPGVAELGVPVCCAGVLRCRTGGQAGD